MANSTILYACTSDGLVILTRPGTLPEWLPPRRVLEGQAVTSAWAEPGPPIRVIAVADGAMMLSENGGRTWTPVEMPAPVLSVFAMGEPIVLLAMMKGGALSVSSDSGTIWQPLPALPLDGDVRSLCEMDGRVYLLIEEGGSSVILAGDLHAGNWRTLVAGETITALACDPTDKKLYAAFSDGVRVSGDAGVDWTTLLGSPGDVTALAAIPGATDKPATLIAGTTLGLSASQDGGRLWQALELGEEGGAFTLARDPERRDRIYAATSSGYLYESGNRGQAWEHINPYPLPPSSSLFVLRI